MSSKGIDFFSTIHGEGIRTRLRINHSSGGEVAFTGAQGPYEQGHIEVDSDGLGIFESSKEVVLSVEVDGAEVTRWSQLIDARWAKLPGGQLTDTLATPSRIITTARGQFAISCGFGDTSLQQGRSDVMYLTATPAHGAWMGELSTAHAPLRFSDIVLPAAHNAGMYGPDDRTWHEVEELRKRDLLPLHKLIPTRLIRDEIITAAINSAFTQKDDLPTMLNTGIRFFDFRPGVFPGTTTIRHVHTQIPGRPMEQFVPELLLWLEGNPSEIAVLKIHDSGVHEACRPPEGAAERILQAAFATSSVRRGSAADLDQTTMDLVDAGTRLIVLGNDHCYGSWPTPIGPRIRRTSSGCSTA